jgi:hypothetical protein
MKMKALTATFLMMSLSATAQADGYRCQTVDGDLNVKIFNHTQAAVGTRNGAIMVLSNPEVLKGRKTIATFTSEKGTLAQKGATYVGKVDLRVSGSDRAGEYVGGTRLGELKHVVVAIDHNILQPVAEGTELSGTISFLKRDGGDDFQELACVRYLKGE